MKVANIFSHENIFPILSYSSQVHTATVPIPHDRVLPVGAVHDEDEAVHLVVILRPDPAEALAAAQVIDGDVVTLQYSTVQYITVRYGIVLW